MAYQNRRRKLRHSMLGFAIGCVVATAPVADATACAPQWGNIALPLGINVVDIQCMLLSLLAADPPVCLSGNLDINCSGTADVLDLQLLLLKVLGAPPGSNCDVDADGCPDACVKKGVGGCQEFCRVWGTAGSIMYCPLRIAAGSCCYIDHEVISMSITLTYPELHVSPKGLYEPGCAEAPLTCSPKSLFSLTVGQYYWWPPFTGSFMTYSPTHDILLQPAFSQAKGSFTLIMVHSVSSKKGPGPFTNAQYTNEGDIVGQDEVLAIGFKLLNSIAESDAAAVCFEKGVVEPGWVTPLAFPWINPDHVLVWSRDSCGCSTCN